ncbi:MAG TPA: ABC transporter ATP-binding protein [Candidatus Solibacter sp.]|jgi:branched-chain amino acid transport system ATP-binding protein|nr:ABC transporter ATP-binding protein [Candidatus Solibacter sp.]
MSATAGPAPQSTAKPNGELLLELTDVNVSYGVIRALRGITVRVDKGEIVTLIGANGAGKSTTVRTIAGLVRPTSGSIRFEGDELGGLSAESIVRRGIALAPEGRHIFARMSVYENLLMGAYARRDKDGIQADIDRAFELFPRLAERRAQLGGTLSGGEQQMLSIGRALMPRPRLLLLDEPSLGLSPVLTETIFQTLQEINNQGTTVLLIEQNALMALKLAHRGYVLETGEVVHEGPAQDLMESPEVQRAYLGI